MRNLRHILLLLGALSVGALVAAVRQGLIPGLALAQQSSATRAIPAMTIEMEERIGPLNGPLSLSDRITVGFSGDGAVASRHLFHQRDGAYSHSLIAIDAPGGAMIRAYPELFAFNGMKLPKRDASLAAMKLDPARDCAVQMDGRPHGNVVERETLLGYRTVRFTSENPSARMQSWLAPDLGCFELKRIAEFKDSRGAGESISELLPLWIGRGVDRGLFEVPANYELLSSWELHRRTVRARTGGEAPESHRARFEEADRAFASHAFDPRVAAK